MRLLYVCLVVLCVYNVTCAGKIEIDDDDSLMHNFAKFGGSNVNLGAKLINEKERQTAFWHDKALAHLHKQLKQQPNRKPAKNIILFLGDGMGISTHTAARIYQGQLQTQLGEENSLFFETLPYTGLSKTYCVDAQVADSACTSTAYTNGVKASIGTMGLNAQVALGDCKASMNVSTHTESIIKWAMDEGKSTGIVTTARITHASPGGLYSHIANRDWESDTDRPFDVSCQDIASQLVKNSPGNMINVLMGGGLHKFKLQTAGGKRKDECLIDAYRANRDKAKDKYKVVFTKEQLNNISAAQTDYVLGLFAGSHMNYELDKPADEPTLTEMTKKAIEILKKNDKGFYLFVEGGRIDMAHHSSKAKKALTEAIEFDNAIKTAYGMTNPEETLIVVTADHSHTFTIAGYPERGNDLLGNVKFGGQDYVGLDKLPYLTLGYNNGPGYSIQSNGQRTNVAKEATDHKDYEFPSGIPLNSETHGGEDVAVFSSGPWAHLLVGNFEQNYIPMVMSYAARIGPGKGVALNGAAHTGASIVLLSMLSLLVCFVLRRE